MSRPHMLLSLGTCFLLLPFRVLAADTIQFNRDIRPILADKCFACHGPDRNKREAEIRLDTGEGTTTKRDGKATIVPGKPEESELIRRILATDDDVRMPPPETKKSVTPEQLALLKQWIAQGAPFEPHWSFLSPKRPEPPAAGAGWARNPIDHFVAAGQAAHGFTPAPDADRRVLARRWFFDLLGLPPTPEQVEAFLADSSPQAAEKLVDQLLKSPHFGERLATYWLDVVRYADSGGYHSDNEREVSPYRDYVISAFNENLSFDRFTIEQIAGDLLPQATSRQRIASGYNRLLQTTEEGGAQPKEYAAKYQADRVRNTAVAWLGITMGCCECHDHKYDPFSTRDFYSLAAFFADVQEKPVGRQDQTPVPTPEQEAELARLAAELRPLQEEFQRDTPQLAASRKSWEETIKKELAAGRSDWRLAEPKTFTASSGTELKRLEDQSLLASGANPDRETYTVTLETGDSTVTGLRLEALTHDSLAKRSLSQRNGNFVLSEVEITAQGTGQDRSQPVKIQAAEADFSQDEFPVAHAIDGKSDTGWGVAGDSRIENRRAIFRFAAPVPARTTLSVKLRHETKHAGQTLGRFRLALTAVSEPGLIDHGGLPAPVHAALAVEPARRSPDQNQTLTSYHRSVAVELAELRQRIAQLEGRRQELEKAFPLTLVSMSVAPRTVRILPRGNWLDDSGEIMQPATPASLPAAKWEDRGRARLALAQWLVRRDHPLTARVFVNRLWKLFFGAGIVRTLDDLGVQGAPPTHPELLDWLAVEFMESGWNVKHLIRLMVLSRTYQQSSQVAAAVRDRDPANLWLARQTAFRLDAEFVRDNALSVSGLLVPKIGGRSVRPYQPAGYWRYLNFPTREWQNDHGESLYRRGLYTHWQRTFLQPGLLAFDASTREECTVDRPRSNTPLQALVLLNDPTYIEAARVLAARSMERGGADPAERVRLAFRQVLQRTPTAAEADVLRKLLEKHRADFAADRSAAEAFLKIGEYPLPAGADPIELAALSSVCRAILNLHETITRY